MGLLILAPLANAPQGQVIPRHPPPPPAAGPRLQAVPHDFVHEQRAYVIGLGGIGLGIEKDVCLVKKIPARAETQLLKRSPKRRSFPRCF